MGKNKKTQTIKLIIAIFVVIVFATIVIARIIKYQNEGEKNMPFTVSKIIIISTAQENKANTDSNKTNNNSGWNFDILQNNDVYISIEKSNTKKNEKIKNITIENIQITQNPEKGNIKAYMPSSLDSDKYTYTNNFLVNGSLTYRAADQSNLKNLQINKDGGTLGISFVNDSLGKYSSGEDTQITYDGTMLSKLGITDDNLKFKVVFDLIIELDDGKKYLGKIELEMPCEKLIENGTSKLEITDFSNTIFKRI